MNERITKALISASQIAAGTNPPSVTAEQLTDALLGLGDTRKRAEETKEACFSRLVRERDADVELLAKAIDTLEQQPDAVKARLYDSASTMIDQHVEKNRRRDESTPQATARLARENDPSFCKLYEHLRWVQREL